MKVKVAEAIVAMINLHYDGGIEKFVESGGGLAYVPAPVDKVVLKTVPDIPKDILKALQDMKDVIITEKYNFSIDIEVIERKQEDLMTKISSHIMPESFVMMVTPLCNVVSVPSKKSIEKIKKLLLKEKGCALSFIICKDEFVTVEGGPTEGPKEKQALVPEKSKDRVDGIKPDDILNLRIDLETTEDCLDFINRM